MSSARSSGWWETIKVVIEALLIAMVVRVFFYQPFNIPSGSMEATLLVGDYLFVSKFSYGYSRASFPFGIVPLEGRVWSAPPERGDIIVFKTPADITRKSSGTQPSRTGRALSLFSLQFCPMAAIFGQT